MTGETAADAERPRALTTDERGVLDGLLAHDFPGVSELRRQAAAVSATSGCGCGCGTITLHVSADATRSGATSPAPVEGTVVGEEDEPVGGVLLFVDNGRLSALETYPLGNDPLPMPPADRVRWDLTTDIAANDDFPGAR